MCMVNDKPKTRQALLSHALKTSLVAKPPDITMLIWALSEFEVRPTPFVKSLPTPFVKSLPTPFVKVTLDTSSRCLLRPILLLQSRIYIHTGRAQYTLLDAPVEI